ncbi:hypothetical protein [Yoonia sp. BS5-3]|uniref:Uncharacterized protein n=1 Tax=Yoonia phaeophyticola TaxID=3137369 RepID=A0ABZ2V290_9RHOB
MTDMHDPKGLIRESFRMEGITAPECRTIFLDWALGLPQTADTGAAVTALLAAYADQPADHPMLATLRAALTDTAPAKRRGGRKGRMQA